MFSVLKWRSSARGFTFFLVVAAHCILIPSHAHAEPFSLICMPDPQFYTNSNHASLYDLYGKQARWIRDNKAAFNIKHVIWLGDLTNDNTLGQWTTANGAYTILDQANIPYSVVPGNHDYRTTNSDTWVGACQRDLTLFNKIVGPQRFKDKAWYGGNKGATGNHNENNYAFFSADGIDFLVIGLEYAPRKETLTWANNLISQYPNHRVIIFTHAYLTVNGNYTGGAGNATGTVGADGVDIFEECASRHSNVFLVVCGHVTESKVNTKVGVSGNTVYEMLVDYQGEKVKGTGDSLGNGWLRIMQFDPATNKIHGSTITVAEGDTRIFTNGTGEFYNGPYGKLPTAIDHLFTLNYNMQTPPQPYTYLNRSVTFHAMAVNNDLLGDQLDPDIGQADNGNWGTVWEDDSNQDGTYEILVRGFDPDGNVRFDKSVVNTTGTVVGNATNPSMAMAADGRFVVVWQRGTTEIRMRTYNADGTPTGEDQSVIAVSAPGTVTNPDVAIDDSGNYVVTWTDDGDGNGAFQVRARGFRHDYTQRFAAKTINTDSAGNQQNPVIAMTGNGDYVIAWEDNKAGTWDINMRGFLANESQKFAQTSANSTIDGTQQSPDIAMDDTGRFVIVWEDDADLNSSYQILGRGFVATGTELFSERTINVNATGNQINPTVAIDPNGNWYAAWEDNGISGEGYQMMTNVFSVAGTRLNAADIRVNPATSVSHSFGTAARKSPVISVHKSGRYIVAWADDMDGNGSYQVLARGLAGFARSLVIKAIDGTATKSPDSPFYAPNETVTITAAPSPGHSFLRWSGDVPAGSETLNPLPVSMSSNKNITAQFSGSTAVADWQLY